MTILEAIAGGRQGDSGERPTVTTLAAWEMAARPESVSVTRAFVRAILRGYPQVDLVEWLVSEVFTNSVQHSLSGADRLGTVSVTVSVTSDARLRVSVGDDGGPGAVHDRWSDDVMVESGRGWHLVEQLSTACGSVVMDDGVRVTWFEVPRDASW
jgi:anti-sigma regulatory factor (Ser/Thr protein kinase)